MTDMKTRFPIYAALVLISLLASCSKDFTSMADVDAPLEMKLQPMLAGETKASMQTSDLTEFYLLVECPQDPAYTYFTRVTKNGTEWTPERPLFWKDSTASVTYTAVYFDGFPFSQANFTDGVSSTNILPDQSTQEKLNSEDLLILKSTNTTYKATTNGILPVEFKHGLAKVNFVLTLGDAFYDALIGLVYNPVKDFIVHGAEMNFSYNPKTGVVTVENLYKGNITPLESTYTPSTPKAKTATANYEAIIVPQTFAKGELKVTFKIGKGTYEWTNDSEITLESGKTYNLPISVNSAPPVETHNGRVYVDMGLSVKWATCNVGATTPFESGDCFAWGETEPYYESLDPLKWKTGISDGYGLWSYKYYDRGSSVYITKYNATDNKTTLEPGDDAATANWGGSWRTPTYDEWKELLSSCDKKWKTKADGFANDGMLITSSKTGNSIFLPYVGYFEYKDFVISKYYYYWSSSLRENTSWDVASSILLAKESNAGSYSLSSRYYGMPVRPVCP